MCYIWGRTLFLTPFSWYYLRHWCGKILYLYILKFASPQTGRAQSLCTLEPNWRNICNTQTCKLPDPPQTTRLTSRLLQSSWIFSPSLMLRLCAKLAGVCLMWRGSFMCSPAVLLLPALILHEPCFLHCCSSLCILTTIRGECSEIALMLCIEAWQRKSERDPLL